MNMKRLAVIALTALSALLATAPYAHADTNCSTTYSTFQTITGNLVVPNNATCVLSAGASVTGNATVGTSSTLIMQGGTVTGNVQGSNCGVVVLITVAVSGNVQIQNCVGTSTYPYGGFVEASSVGGDFQCHNNTTAQYPCVLFLSSVKGNAQVQNNVSSFPSVIAGNTIAKNLQCQNNTPAPTNMGVKNTVTGNPGQSNEAQCLNF